MSYPKDPGFQNTDTSREAADTIDARNLRDTVLAYLAEHESSTADEIASGLDIDRLSIRPRCSELRLLGCVFDTGLRRTNTSGRKAIVWGTSPGGDR